MVPWAGPQASVARFYKSCPNDMIWCATRGTSETGETSPLTLPSPRWGEEKVRGDGMRESWVNGRCFGRHSRESFLTPPARRAPLAGSPRLASLAPLARRAPLAGSPRLASLAPLARRAFPRHPNSPSRLCKILNAAIVAVSPRRMRSPIEMGTNPPLTACSSSSCVQPPSGPTAILIEAPAF